MTSDSGNAAAGRTEAGKLRIYLLPNLFTAGNLFCGFLAMTKIVEADITPTSLDIHAIRQAILFIILACLFDLLDGRVARFGGQDSPFGREFDSLADIISFGAAPAFLVHRVVLRDVFSEHHPEIGWFLASVYLICGAFRLARFNILAAQGGGGGKDFLGFPIPAAAGTVASITLFLLWLDDNEWLDERFAHSPWRYVLPIIMVFLSFMMVSEVKYPSFKSLDWRAKRTFPKMVGIILFAAFLFIARHKILPVVLPLIFTAYLIYGFIRPRLSRKIVQEIEDEEDEEGSSLPS
jgi:CDP-diacylglycerol--serine O-phosphatidyltransferase